MESIFVDFYKNLFSKDNLDLHVQQSLKDDLEFTLSDSERVSCEETLLKMSYLWRWGVFRLGNRLALTAYQQNFIRLFGKIWAMFKYLF